MFRLFCNVLAILGLEEQQDNKVPAEILYKTIVQVDVEDKQQEEELADLP